MKRKIIVRTEEERKENYLKKHSRCWEKCFSACVSLNVSIFGVTYLFHDYLERIAWILFLTVFSNSFAATIGLERIITKSERFNLKQGIKPEVMGAFRYGESYKFPWGGFVAGGIAGIMTIIFYLPLWH